MIMKTSSIFFCRLIFISIAFFAGYNRCLAADSPVLFFTDFNSGPKTGLGDGTGSGAIVTVWGRNLGAVPVNSKLYIGTDGNWHEAAHIYYWKNADGQLPGGPSDVYSFHKMQEIAFSIPEGVSDGPVKIKVNVNGVDSNQLDFTVRSGNMYFIDDTSPGNPGSGTFSDPWRSPASFINRINSSGANEDGAIAYFKSGNYSEQYAQLNWSANFCLGANHSGQNNLENVFSVYPGERPVIDSMADTMRTGFRLYSTMPEYITVSKMSIHSMRGSLEAGDNWRAVGNLLNGIHELSASGVIVPSGNNIILYGNEMTGGTSANKLDHAIYPNRGADNVDIGWNYIHDNNWAEGPMISINNNEAYDLGYTFENIRIHHNVIDVTQYPSRAVGVFETGAGSTIYVYSNIIKGPAPSGSPSVYAMSGNVHYYNNSLYEAGAGNMGSAFSFYSSVTYEHLYAPESIEIKNNVVHVNPGSSLYIRVTGDAPAPDISNNCYFGIGTYNPATGNSGIDTGAINADPIYNNSSGNDFSLTYNSPCIDTGQALVDNLFKNDFTGIARPQSSGWDIGAHEFISGETDTAPPTIPGGLRIR